MFLGYPSTQSLKEYAKNPPDLTNPTLLTADRLQRYSASGGGYQLIYGTERVNDSVLDALKTLAEESAAVEKMAAMQAGEIVNKIEGDPSENRPALHTATRDFFEDPQTSEAAKQAAASAKKEIEKLKTFMEVLDQKRQFNDLILIGIGGSELGPHAHY